MPEKHSWLLFKQWADEYGPIFRFTIGNQNNVVVSTEKIANDLLRERGGLYSSREQSVFAAELMSRNLRPLFLPYNGTLRFAIALTIRVVETREEIDASYNDDTNG
jgi:hypothetical protein